MKIRAKKFLVSILSLAVILSLTPAYGVFAEDEDILATDNQVVVGTESEAIDEEAQEPENVECPVTPEPKCEEPSCCKYYTVTYVDGFDNSILGKEKVKCGNDATFKCIKLPVREGYCYSWSSMGKCIKADTTIVAKPVQGKFVVKYVGENGKLIHKEVVAYNGDVKCEPKVPQKPGYTGVWNHSGKNIKCNMIIMPIYKKKCDAKFFTVTYIDGYDGSVIGKEKVKAAGNATFKGIYLPVREGYVYAWSSLGRNIHANTVIVAQPIKIQHHVTYIDEKGRLVHTELVFHGGDVKCVPAVPYKEGYNGVWDHDGKNIRHWTIIKPVYELKEFTVTYVDEVTGETIGTETVKWGQDAIGMELPEREGYTYTGWDNDGKCIKQDTTITAKATKNKYVVTYVTEDGEKVYDETVEYGNDVQNVPEVPEKEGYDGVWDDEGKNITEDRTIHPIYTIKKVTVTYYENDHETVVKVITIDWGTGVEAADIPEVPGLEGFTGKWDDTDVSCVKENLSVYPEYSPVEPEPIVDPDDPADDPDDPAEEPEEQDDDAVKTGDSTNIMLMLLMMLGSGSLLTALAIRRRKC